MFQMEKSFFGFPGKRVLMTLLAPVVFPTAVFAAGEYSHKDPETGITVIRAVPANVSSGGYMTGKELQAVYGKALEKNLPYDLKLGTVDEVTFSEEGDVTAHMVITEVYQMMPSSMKKRMEDEYYNKAKARYCRSVAAGKHNLHRIKSLSIEAFTVYGDPYRKVTVTPLMCLTHKD